jgi:hypothetical protein
LLTLALGRLESLRTRTRALAVNSQWLGVLVVVAGLVVLAALLVGQLVSFDLLIVGTRPLFELLGGVLVLLLYALVIPLAYVVEWLVYLGLSLVQSNAGQQPPQPPQPSEVDDLLRRLFAQLVPIDLVMALKALGAALLVVCGLLIVARAVARWRPSSADAEATNEERDSVFDARRARKLWLEWLGRLLRRRATIPDRQARLTTQDLAGAVPAELLSVRDLYRHLLRLGDAVGVRRALATTPIEHLPLLQESLEPADHVADLTQAYVQARYAESEAQPGEVDALREAVQRIRPINAGN